MTVLLVLVAIGFVSTVVIKSKKWAVALQQYYVRSVKNRDSYFVDFGKSWIRVLFQAGIIFFAIIFVLLIFSFCFGTIYV